MSHFDRYSPVALAEHLQTALAGGLPGRAAQRTMAHRLAYGRHHGPIPADARQAAVLVALDPQASGWSIPAILRPDTMKTHAGQISLPGGAMDSQETVVQAALREFEEELGAATTGLSIIGQLTPVYVFVSGFQITPVLAVSRQRLVFQPNPQEVAAVVELPLAELCNSACRHEHKVERRGLQFTVPHFAVAGQRVWGATSLILAEFVALLQAANVKVGQ
jgi:8-oxo-dGTP pyrophosphatase MutT (NUDIX family)